MYETDLSSTYHLNYNVDEVAVVNPATNVYFDRSSITLDTEVKTSENLSQYVVIVPEDSTDNDPLEWDWDSSDDKVATVDNNGIVTAVGKGTANITVTIGNCTATIPVTVTVPVTGVEFEGLTSVDLDLTTKPQMSIKDYVKVSPENAEVTAYNWRSDNEKVATVDNNGVVTAVVKGTANIIVEVSGHEATIPVNVKASVGSVSFDVPNVVLDTKTETQYKLKDHIVFDPEGAEYTEITWKSSDDKVATVDGNGVVTGIKEGKATITATIAGKSDTYEVTVKEVHAEGIIISDETIENLQNAQPVVGDTLEIPFTVNPEDCTDIEEEILEFVKTQFDEEMVDVTVSYDQETKTGTISVTTKKAGTTEVTVEAGEETYVMSFNVTEPVVETPEEEAPETGDMPVVAMAIIMTLSIVGIVASRKLLVK